MGKVPLDESSSKCTKQNRKLLCKKIKYLKPGLLAQHRSRKATIAKPYTDSGNERIAVLNGELRKCVLESDLIVKPIAISTSPVAEKMDANQSDLLMKTPTTPLVSNDASESTLESLPMDLLVKIVCHLHHDELKPTFHVSQRLRKAVMLARQIHFNYKTPIRSRQDLMRMHTPIPAGHWPFQSQGSLHCAWVSSPHTPKAPKPAPRPPSRLKYTDLRQIAAVLFPETSRYMVPPALQKTPCKALASHRVLFYEEELCQAVAQNKLR